MKSITVSLLVAFGLTLGAANAFAETRTAPFNAGSAAQSAMQEAREHEQKAQQYRVTARLEEQAAKDSMKIAIYDEQKGFPYEASVQRGFAQKHQNAAAAATRAAVQEDMLAANCHARAAQLTMVVNAPFQPSATTAAKVQLPRR